MKKIISSLIQNKKILNIGFSIFLIFGFCQLFASNSHYEKINFISKQELCKVSQNQNIVHTKLECIEQTSEFEDDDNENEDNFYYSCELINISSSNILKFNTCNTVEKRIEFCKKIKKVPLFILFSNLKLDFQN